MGTVAIIGLGNPGTRYRSTRHNLGFLTIEELCVRRRTALAPGRGPYWFAQATDDAAGTTAILVQPTTFMNASGEAVEDVCTKFEVPPSSVLVVLDDFWLPLGRIRFRMKGSDGGHNGLASVILTLGTDDIPRLRLGIGVASMPPKDSMADFVLSPFQEGEVPVVKDMIARAANAAEQFIRTGFAITANDSWPPGNESPSVETD